METKTILIVDDEQMILDTFQAFLELEGYKVHTANCVANAKLILVENKINLVLTDLKMPGENGIEFLTYLNKNYANIPVVMITGNPDAKATYIAYEKGIMDFLIKPISRKALTGITNKVFSDLDGGDEEENIDELLRGLK